ncbi:para-aminobenzoate synthetase/4-amino-4-deoxychorismate lyase [Bacillus oleivorans]|uniref:Para-aminobenzoate synthetase/4-amino-4-deoxychorismate lyase n=1 Tax=Bacillus oleivorans TaxID=1448271 RepID=A0A285CSN5_9BACI|nr:aminodeoxychorismate synthase component I [Bacillus oleivorans]SNX69963.1 para-aminobenzoate synthetase/4-amino-4-deoxychorismate lyase [Bacillus oleivorans]
MPNNKQKPFLSFEFASLDGVITPLTFSDPIKVISAEKIEDVLPSFQLVQDAVNNGYYAAGFLSYESAAAFDSAYKLKHPTTMPFLWFGIFSEPQLKNLTGNDPYVLTEWKPNVSLDEYRAAISFIKQSIESGDTYQTNYTIRLKSRFDGDELSLFEKMKRAQASNYSAFIQTEDHSILSASPELFFHLKGETITTRPMKGTIKRGKSFEEDQQNASWLYQSEKNRAENVMIVDLLRNDLGIIAEPGSVEVTKLFEIEQYPTVHQMTSTITAKVPAHTQIVDIFKALFPCGSITGAPKISTMNIIAELETTPRNVYCGAIGYISPNKEAIFNVPIRTVVIEKQSGQATYGVGGGITWDSTFQGEYHEILAKSKILEEDRPEFQLLESILLNRGEYFLLEEHLNRINQSAQYFGFTFKENKIKKTLADFARRNPLDSLKVRFLLDKSGEFTIEGQPIQKPKSSIKVSLAKEPVDRNHLFLYHKTSNRQIYSKFQKEEPHVFDVLLWNEDRELTEFTNGNVVLEIDGSLWTPPVNSGLLAGTFREVLIKEGVIQEKTLTLSDLEKSPKIWFINSVRKWLEVELIEELH